MSLSDFLKKSTEAAPKKFDRSSEGASDYVKSIFMNAPVNQGVLKFIPITPVIGPEVKYVYDVMEFQVYTLNDDKEQQWRWGRVPQIKDFIEELSKDQKDKIGSIQSKIKSIIELGYGTDWAREGKNYALIFGYVLNHINADKEVLIDVNSRQMALLVFPSKNVAKAMTTMGESLITSAAGEAQYAAIFNREANNRNCYLEFSFKQGSGFGYDVVIGTKTFDIFSAELLTPEEQKKNSVDIPEALIEKVTTHTALFMGNREGTTDYVPEYMDRLSDQLDAEINKTVTEKQAAAEVARNLQDLDSSANKPNPENWPKS